MSDAAQALVVGVLAFVATDIDDLILLAVLFADPKLRPAAVVVGQLAGIGALVAASAAAAWLVLAVPGRWIAWLGLVPAFLGFRGLLQAIARRRATEAAPAPAPPSANHRVVAQVIAVAAVTIANGADNLGVYIPMFAAAPHLIALYAAIFAAMTLAWCMAGRALATHPVVGARLRRHGDFLVPLVLIGIGIHIFVSAT